MIARVARKPDLIDRALDDIEGSVREHAPPDADSTLIANRQGYAQAAHAALCVEALAVGLRAITPPRDT